MLKGNVERYIFISTVAVYADDSKPDEDETAAVARYSGAAPMRETLQTLRDSKGTLYGPLKALAEQEAQKSFPGQTLIIRPGLVVGPGDETDRFTYWPVRLDRGGGTLAPGAPTDPVQFIDARDLAEWTIRMAEDRETGVYNATGPAEGLTMGAMLDGIQQGIGSRAELVWVDPDFLAEHKVEPWSDLPVWLPARGETLGFARRDIRRALSRGLTFRSLSDTARDSLTWFKTLPATRQRELRSGLTSDREAGLLTTWQVHARPSTPEGERRPT